ncbi:hypothetical protein [Gemmata palustris]|nr:hypothetical protein [Gemmata palustris]
MYQIRKYCVELHEQALAYLKDNNESKESARVEQSSAKVENGK